MSNYISKILVNGVEYEIKDTVARQGGVRFILSTDAASTPLGVEWTPSGGDKVTGTLTAANADKNAIYLVPGEIASVKNIYREFVAVNTTGTTYIWEQLGDTEIDLKDVVTGVTLNKGNGATVYGSGNTFANSSSTVSFSGGSTQSVLTGITPSSSNMVVESITGINGSESITPVSSSTDVTIPNIQLGAASSASKIVTESKTATNTVFGTAASVNKVSAGTAVAVAKAGTAVTQILSGDISSVFTAATVSDETLSFTSSSVTKNSITPAVSNGSITPVTIGDAVTVPQLTSNTEVAIASVKTNTDVSVPSVTAGDPISASKVVLGTAVNLAKPAASAQAFATGSLAANGTGATVITGVATPDSQKATVVKTLGTATAAAQEITISGSGTKVANYDDLSLTVSKPE